MDFITGGIICIGLLLGLMGAGIQIGLAFILSGFLVSTLLLGFNGSLSLVGTGRLFFQCLSHLGLYSPLYPHGVFCCGGWLCPAGLQWGKCAKFRYARLTWSRHMFQLRCFWGYFRIVHCNHRHFRENGPTGNEPPAL